MFDKYLYALGRGVRGAKKALSETATSPSADPALDAKDVTPPQPAGDSSSGKKFAATETTIDEPKRKEVSFGERPLIMGIVNATPDSFSDGGLFFDPQRAEGHALELIAQGADILDIGGESTRPNATPVDAAEESQRVIPVVTAITARTEVPISIDTMKPVIAEAAINAGASIVNDVWGFQKDSDMARVVSGAGVSCVLMHNRVNDDPEVDMFEEVRSFLSRSLDIALAAGINENRIVLDPGIGFGKTAGQGWELVRRLGELKSALKMPILLGVSRKRLIGEATGQADAADRDAGSLAAGLFGIAQGADILRVHNVQMHVEALKVAAVLQQPKKF